MLPFTPQKISNSIIIYFILNLYSHTYAHSFEKFHKSHDIMFSAQEGMTNHDKKTVVIVGAGPAGLASAIALKKSKSFDKVIVLEKRNKYTREQIANITTHAILSMIELEPRILMHLLELGRAFFYDEHIHVENKKIPKKFFFEESFEFSFPTSWGSGVVNIRPFQKSIQKVFKGSLKIDYFGKSSKLDQLPQIDIDEYLLEGAKLKAGSKMTFDRHSAYDIAFASPINDIEHVLNFVAINYYDIQILKKEVNWGMIEKIFQPDLFVDATGSKESPHFEIESTQQDQSKGPWSELSEPKFNCLPTDNMCNLFPWMFNKHSNFSNDNIDRASGSPRFEIWESVFHEIEDLNPDISRSTITVSTEYEEFNSNIERQEFYTFVVMPQHSLTFELRPSSSAFLAKIGVEFSGFDQDYYSKNYLESEKKLESTLFCGFDQDYYSRNYLESEEKLESTLNSSRKKVGKSGYFTEKFTKPEHILDQNTTKISTPVIYVGDRAFQGLAYLGLGASNCFSIYADRLSKGIKEPYAKEFNQDITKTIESNLEASKKTIANMFALPKALNDMSEVDRHDLVSLANTADELRVTISFLEWLHEHATWDGLDIVKAYRILKEMKSGLYDITYESVLEVLGELNNEAYAKELREFYATGIMSKSLISYINQFIDQRLGAIIDSVLPPRESDYPAVFSHIIKIKTRPTYRCSPPVYTSVSAPVPGEGGSIRCTSTELLFFKRCHSSFLIS